MVIDKVFFVRYVPANNLNKRLRLRILFSSWKAIKLQIGTATSLKRPGTRGPTGGASDLTRTCMAGRSLNQDPGPSTGTSRGQPERPGGAGQGPRLPGRPRFHGGFRVQGQVRCFQSGPAGQTCQ